MCIYQFQPVSMVYSGTQWINHMQHRFPNRSRLLNHHSIQSEQQSAQQSTQQSTQWHCVHSHSMMVQRAGIIPQDDTAGSIERTATNDNIHPKTKPHPNLNHATAVLISFTNDHEDRHRQQSDVIQDCPSLRNRLAINQCPTKQHHVVFLGISE